MGAALAILIAGGANLVAKAAVAIVVGGLRHGRTSGGPAALAIAAGRHRAVCPGVLGLPQRPTVGSLRGPKTP